MLAFRAFYPFSSTKKKYNGTISFNFVENLKLYRGFIVFMGFPMNFWLWLLIWYSRNLRNLGLWWNFTHITKFYWIKSNVSIKIFFDQELKCINYIILKEYFFKHAIFFKIFIRINKLMYINVSFKKLMMTSCYVTSKHTLHFQSQQ